MDPYPRRYNYDHFRFADEDAEVAFWEAHAPALGGTAPDFMLPDLEGRPWRLEDQRGRPVVIEFGSYTCPIFCGHVRRMESLADEHPEAMFIVIYVREAHPGEVTPPHRHDEDKRAAANIVVATEGIRRTVLVDSVDGAVHRMYGAGYDGVFVVDPEGHVVVRRFWNEPQDVRSALITMRAGMRPVPVESLSFGAPSSGRPPVGAEMIERGGREAVSDFAKDAPNRIRRQLEASGDAVLEVLRSDAP